METRAVSRRPPQSSPDKLVASAHVTSGCFLHQLSFIHANKLNLPRFGVMASDGAIFFLPSPRSKFDLLDNSRDARLTAGRELHAAFSSSKHETRVLPGFLMEVEHHNF